LRPAHSGPSRPARAPTQRARRFMHFQDALLYCWQVFRERLMSAELIWIVAGILLILSELIATGVVAVFFGSSAIITGLLLSAGLIESPAVQFSLFGTLSLLQLLL